MLINRGLYIGSFLTGGLAIAWMAQQFLHTSPLGLGVTILIALVYLLGSGELYRFRAATQGLGEALTTLGANPPADEQAFSSWMASLPGSLKPAVTRRLDGESTGLPAPVLTPYLVSLLVMLGLLGTFAGMVGTLQGAVEALRSTTQLEAIRSGLTTPIGGLSLAFGTSVAGVAASAMLGLMSALSRRDRLLVARELDSALAAGLKSFSRIHRQEALFTALQAQSESLPAVGQELLKIGSQLTAMGENLERTLIARQDAHLQRTEQSYRDLAESVGLSLRESLVSGTRESARQLQAELTASAAVMREELQSQLMTAFERLERQNQEQAGAAAESLQNTSTELLKTLQTSVLEWTRELANADRERLQQWTQTLQTETRQQATSMESVISEVRELMQTATEAPKAAAEVILSLREELAAQQARENQLLEEREQSLARIVALANQLENTLQTQQQASQSINSSSMDLQSLAGAFATAVQDYQGSNAALQESLASISERLQESAQRSDEQLGYYVAQARELIDHSLLAQKQTFEELQQLRRRETAEAN